LDKLIISQPILQQHWFQYRDIINTIKLDPSKYDCNINDIIQLENICNDIESTLLSGNIFEVCIIIFKYIIIIVIIQFKGPGAGFSTFPQFYKI